MSTSAEAMDAVRKHFECSCAVDYSQRDRTDPLCMICNFDDAIAEFAEAFAAKAVAAERERIAKEFEDNAQRIVDMRSVGPAENFDSTCMYLPIPAPAPPAPRLPASRSVELTAKVRQLGDGNWTAETFIDGEEGAYDVVDTRDEAIDRVRSEWKVEPTVEGQS